jgi:ADP-ribose pyrophosphatase YjhB (NUDIX family)
MKKTKRVDYWRDPDAPKPTTRKASASVFVLDDAGRLLLLHRADSDAWTIPTGGVKKGETVAQAAVRECREETGLEVEVIGLVGVFSTPDHVIVYMHGKKIDEVRQPINVCVRARVTGGEIRPEPGEAREVRWVARDDLDAYPIGPAIRHRIDHGLTDSDPYIE